MNWKLSVLGMVLAACVLSVTSGCDQKAKKPDSPVAPNTTEAKTK